jgi:hypothetical protein
MGKRGRLLRGIKAELSSRVETMKFKAKALTATRGVRAHIDLCPACQERIKEIDRCADPEKKLSNLDGIRHLAKCVHCKKLAQEIRDCYEGSKHGKKSQ